MKAITVFCTKEHVQAPKGQFFRIFPQMVCASQWLGVHLLSSGVVELVLRGPIEAGLDARVIPQANDDVRHLLGHGALFDGVGEMHELPGVVLHG